MIWRPFENSPSIATNGKLVESGLNVMGQLTSSESPSMANAVDVQSEPPLSKSEKSPETTESERARLGKLGIKPSQPIDICRRPSQARNGTAHLHPFQRHTTATQRVLQRSASEMAPAAQKCPSVVHFGTAQKQQHQPRVIQPRRLATNSANGGTTTAMGGGAGAVVGDGGQMDGEGRRGNSGEGHPREGNNSSSSQREDKEPPNGGPNKENGEWWERSSTGGSSSSKSSRNSRKRLNSMGLGNMDYDALEGTSSAEAANPNEMDKAKGSETKEIPLESEHTEFGADYQMAKEGKGTGTFVHGTPTMTVGNKNNANGTVRRRASDGGRIAYLYGIYGACADASSFADRRTREHRRSAFADQANTRSENGGRVCWDDCCCFEEEGREDELCRMTHGCLVHSLHTVSDIIGYAKVVRAQRNETLGRLNDVMTQFDALIRSYSLAVKNGTSIQRRFDVTGGGDSANGTLQGQTQLEPAA